MKTISQKMFLLLSSFTLLFAACSSDPKENTVIAQKATPNASVARALPPPTPGELRGLYDIKYTTGEEANLLFEYGNYVTYGYPTLHDMATQSGRRSSYVNTTGNVFQFSNTDGVTTYNFRFTYDSSSTIITGTVGMGTSYTNLGSYSGKKHITNGTGLSFLKGYWLGTYTDMYDYVMVFEEDGKLTVGTRATFFSSVIGKGNYELYGDTVIGSYTYPNGYKYSFKGQCNFTAKTINGTWGHGDSNWDGSTFSVAAMNFY